MKRPDAEMIKRIQKSKMISREHLEWACNLPYFYMSHKLMDDFDFANNEMIENVIEEKDDGTVVIKYHGESAEFVYDDFILSCRNFVLVKHGNDYEKTAANYWGWVYIDLGQDLLFLIIQYPPENAWFAWKGLVEIVGETEQNGERVTKYQVRMAPEYEEKMRPWHKSMIEQGRLRSSSFEGFTKGLTKHAGAYYLFVHNLMRYIKYGDKHAVEVVSEKPPKAAKSIISRNRPWLAAKGPRVLLLDRMPTTQGPGTGTHASPKPHRRRGHWKTLSHPRYRHHPQYQKKIYVKPSFVGPRQTTYEGNIYRLVQPLEEAISV